MKLLIYIEDGYFQIDTQTGVDGKSSTPIIEGWCDHPETLKEDI